MLIEHFYLLTLCSHKYCDVIIAIPYKTYFNMVYHNSGNMILRSFNVFTRLDNLNESVSNTLQVPL